MTDYTIYKSGSDRIVYVEDPKGRLYQWTMGINRLTRVDHRPRTGLTAMSPAAAAVLLGCLRTMLRNEP